MKVIRISTHESDVFIVPDDLGTSEEVDAYFLRTEDLEQDVVDSEEYSSHYYTVSKDGSEWDTLE